MAYNQHLTADAVYARLLQQPRTSLQKLSASLGIERHTIRRALLSRFGLTFRELQTQCLLRLAAEMQQKQPGHSAKEVSFAIGYKSAASFARLIKRTRCRLSI